jgi:hypothetical protein
MPQCHRGCDLAVLLHQSNGGAVGTPFSNLNLRIRGSFPRENLLSLDSPELPSCTLIGWTNSEAYILLAGALDS